MECNESPVYVEDGRDSGPGLDLLLGEQYQNGEPGYADGHN